MTKFRLVIALFALSLIFNIFFVIGALGKRPPRGRLAKITQAARELDLDAQQSSRFGEIQAEFRVEADLIGQELHQIRGEIADQLNADSPDSEELSELMQRESELILQRRSTATQHFGHFVDILTPSQRHDLGHRMHPKHGTNERPADPPQVVAQFDADGDGKLNDEERIEAHQAMDRRREQAFRRRAEMREQFDADGDEQLSPQEREAMRAWLLEQGLKPPRNEGGPKGGRPHRGDHRPPRRGPNRTGEPPKTPPTRPPSHGSDPPPPGQPPADG
jgi:uncharacterized membrane protein